VHDLRHPALAHQLGGLLEVLADGRGNGIVCLISVLGRADAEVVPEDERPRSRLTP
jgi:hypothetical protein